MRGLALLAVAGVAAAFVVPGPSALEHDVFSHPQDSPSVNHLDEALDRGWEDHDRIFVAADDDEDADIDDSDDVSNDGPHYYDNLEDDQEASWLQDKLPECLKRLLSRPSESLEREGHGKSNLTVYQLISKSKYTTKLAKLIEDDSELVDVLNKTDATLTLFAPTDEAFEKIPEHAPKPDKKFIKKLLLNHVSGDFYPAGKVVTSYTIPTLLEETRLGGPQRLVVKLGPRGLTINYFSKIVAANIFAANGVIHGVDNIVFLPPPALPLIEATPSVFSTFSLGLLKTGLFKSLSEKAHEGGTLFAPTNRAFQRLGPKINAFLFSKYGTKYLKALLQYHVVLNSTLYSDAFYHDDGSDDSTVPWLNGLSEDSNGFYHLDLATELEGRTIPVDIRHWGHFIKISVNGIHVSYADGPAKDGVIHVVDQVLIPPRKHTLDTFWAFEEDEEWQESDLREALDPFVDYESEDENEDTDTAAEFDDEIKEQAHLANDLDDAWSKMYL